MGLRHADHRDPGTRIKNTPGKGIFVAVIPSKAEIYKPTRNLFLHQGFVRLSIYILW